MRWRSSQYHGAYVSTDGASSPRGRVEMLNKSGLSGAPWGTPAVGVKVGPVYEDILIWILRLWRKLDRILMKMSGRSRV